MSSKFFLIMTFVIGFGLVLIPITLIPSCSGLDGYNKTNSTASTGKAHNCLVQTGPLLNISVLLILPGMFLPLVGMMRFLLTDEDYEEENKKLIQEVRQQIPNSETLTKIPCALCGKNVDRSYNLIKHLGIEQTKQYLSFCDETKTEPTLYCCSCYAMVEKNPNWQRAMDNMIDDSIKYGELKKINSIKSQEGWI